MEMMEDDLFFAELSKQISLLIMDEEGDGDGDVAPAVAPPWHSYPIQDMSYVTTTTPTNTQQGRVHGQPPRHVQEKNQQAMREMSKGTGVFIPKFALPRRRRSTSHHHHHPNNYSRPTNYHHSWHQQHDHCSTRRSSQEEESKANYYNNQNRI